MKTIYQVCDCISNSDHIVLKDFNTHEEAVEYARKVSLTPIATFTDKGLRGLNGRLMVLERHYIDTKVIKIDFKTGKRL